MTARERLVEIRRNHDAENLSGEADYRTAQWHDEDYLLSIAEKAADRRGIALAMLGEPQDSLGTIVIADDMDIRVQAYLFGEDQDGN